MGDVVKLGSRSSGYARSIQRALRSTKLARRRLERDRERHNNAVIRLSSRTPTDAS